MPENLVDIINENHNLIKGKTSTSGWIILFPPFFDRNMNYSKEDYYTLGKKLDTYNAFFLDTIEEIKEDILTLRVKDFRYYVTVRFDNKYVALCNFPDSPIPTNRVLINIASYQRGGKTPSTDFWASLGISIEQKRKGEFEPFASFRPDDIVKQHNIYQPIKDNANKLNSMLKTLK